MVAIQPFQYIVFIEDKQIQNNKKETHENGEQS